MHVAVAQEKTNMRKQTAHTASGLILPLRIAKVSPYSERCKPLSSQTPDIAQMARAADCRWDTESHQQVLGSTPSVRRICCFCFRQGRKEINSSLEFMNWAPPFGFKVTASSTGGQLLMSVNTLSRAADLLPSFGFKVTASSTGGQLLMSVFYFDSWAK